MKVETLSGALIAALIGFLNALLALFLNNPEFTFAQITQAAWVGMLLGAVVQFLKDYQAISTRRIVANLTGRQPYEPSPPT